MALVYIDGNLIKMAKAGLVKAFGHGCNCWCRMGAGFALQVKYNFPAAYYEDFKTVAGELDKLGGFSSTLHYGFPIYNMYTQFLYGTTEKHFDEFAFKSALIAVIEDCILKGINQLHVPKIGAGLGGAAWSTVEEIILNVLFKFPNFELVVVNYVKS